MDASDFIPTSKTVATTDPFYRSSKYPRQSLLLASVKFIILDMLTGTKGPLRANHNFRWIGPDLELSTA